MGRKPNPIILQYFDRGPKLEDASNRYQHTCKLCGDHFAKGRIDSLINHLTKKCKVISLDERREVLLRLHNVGPAADARAGTTATFQTGGNATLPFSPSCQFDRLNVLAEASRQVGATNDPNKSGAYAPQASGEGLVVDPALQNALQEEDFFNNADYYTTKASNFPNTAATSLPPGFPRSTDLCSIAASANETLANVTPSDFGTGPDQDPGSFLSGIQSCPLGMSNNAVFADSSIAWPNPSQAPPQDSLIDLSPDHKPNYEQRMTSFPRPIAINPNAPAPASGLTAHVGLSSKPGQKSNVRKAFDPERKKEVQRLRQIGACIRCRTLKKPCSKETPCLTCQSVEGPRLWKEPCTRARLVDSFCLYAAGLLSTLAHRDVSQIKATLRFDSSADILELSHFDDFHIKISSVALQGQLPAAAVMNGYPNTIPVTLVDRESSELPKKLEEYLAAMAPTLFDREQFHFMKVSLKLAADLAATKHDQLLGKTLDLWTATQTLTDLHLSWKVAIVRESASNTYRAPIDDSTSPASHTVISGQVQGALEKRAEQLSRLVMKQLENRLKEPHKNNQFETFLIAILLLNGAERMSWLFQNWNNAQSAARWPLERSPDTYATQGEGFSDILHMLLKVRMLIPRTTSGPDDGILRTFEKHKDETATKWFEAVGITKKFLEQRLAAQFDPADSRSLDGKYFGKVLV